MVEKSHQSSYQDMNPATGSKSQSGKMCMLIQLWHYCYGSDHECFYCIVAQVYRRGFILDIVNLQKIHGWDFMGPGGGKLITIILVNEHTIQLTSKYVCLYT